MKYSTAWAAQGACPATRLIRGPRPLFPCQASGPALPCRCASGDNLALHRAIMEAKAGAVIVCDARGRNDVAHFGELMALECVRRKIAGLIICGAVRDAEEMEKIGFPVFCTAVSPWPAAKKRGGSIGQVVTVGGVRVTAGDQIIADRDGVLLVRKADWPAMISAIRDTRRREKETRRRMRSGESLVHILKLKI